MLKMILNIRGKIMKMSATDKGMWLLVVVGALNWGLVGFFKYNLVDKVFGAGSSGARVVYCVVGLAAVYSVYKMMAMMSDGKSA